MRIELTSAARARCRRPFALVLVAVLAAGCGRGPQATPPPAGKVDAQRLAGIAAEPGQWLPTGRDSGKTHSSPLQDIDTGNVSRGGFAWE